MVLDRRAADLIRKRLDRYPAVALVGPRQAGKTTLARSFGGAYFDLEREADRLKLDLQWDERSGGKSLVVLDEAQAWPPVFPRLRAAIDRDRSRKGRFLLLGSVSPALMTSVSESLAGRLALVELTPFLLGEAPKVPLRRLWCRGGFAEGGVLEPARFPQWQRDYLSLLAQRDLPNWGLAARPQVIERFLRMVAAVHGQTWNASKIGKSLGLSYHTVNGYLDFLVGAFLVRRLPPLHANLKKRLVRSPKVYWRDSGLLHALLNVRDEDELLGQPWVGASWEGFVIEQVLGRLQQLDRAAEASVFRTSDGYEADLILEFGNKRWAIEVKLTSAPGPADMDRLDKVGEMILAGKRLLISQTRESIESGGRVSCNLPWLLERFEDGDFFR